MRRNTRDALELQERIVADAKERHGGRYLLPVGYGAEYAACEELVRQGRAQWGKPTGFGPEIVLTGAEWVHLRDSHFVMSPLRRRWWQFRNRGVARLRDVHQTLSWKRGFREGRMGRPYSKPWWVDRVVYGTAHIQGRLASMEQRSQASHQSPSTGKPRL